MMSSESADAAVGLHKCIHCAECCKEIDGWAWGEWCQTDKKRTAPAACQSSGKLLHLQLRQALNACQDCLMQAPCHLHLHDNHPSYSSITKEDQHTHGDILTHDIKCMTRVDSQGR